MSQDQEKIVASSPDPVNPNPGTGEPLTYMIWQNLTSMQQALGRIEEKFDGLEKRFDRTVDAVDKRFDKVDGRFDKTDGKIERVAIEAGKTKGKVDKIFIIVTAFASAVALIAAGITIWHSLK